MLRNKPLLIGTPRDSRKSNQNFEFTPIGDENRHTTTRSKAAEIAAGVSLKDRRPLNNNSPFVNKLRGGSSFLDESEYDSIQTSASKQQKHRQQQISSSSPLTGAFHANAHHDLLNSGSNPVRQQQEDFSKLKSDNYNLKVKIASLTKYLNAVTNQEQQYIYEENSRLHEQLIVLREEVSQLSKELLSTEKVTNSQKLAVENSDAYKDEIRKLRAKVQDLEGSLQDKDEMKDTIKELQKLNEGLQRELQDQRAKVPSSSPISKNYVRQLEEDLEGLKSAMDDNLRDIRRRDEELDEKDEMIENFQAQIRDLQQRSFHDPTSEAKIDELRHVINTKDSQLEAQNKEIDDMKNRIQQLKSSMEKADHNANDLIASLRAAEKKITHLEEERMNRSTGERSSEQIRRLQDANIDLESQLEKLHSKFRESKSIISEQARIIGEFNEAESVVEELKREREHMKLKIEQLQRENERTYKAYQDLRKNQQQSRIKKTDDADLWKSEVELLSNKVKDLNMENERLYTDLEKEKQSKVTDNDSYAKIEVKSLTSKCNELQIELSEKDNALQRLSSQYRKELDRYEMALEHKEKELSNVKDELRSLKMTSLQQIDDEKIELIKVKGSKESQIKLLQIELDNVKEQHAMEVDSLKKTIERLRSAPPHADQVFGSTQAINSTNELMQKVTDKNKRIKYLNEKLTEALLSLKETQAKITRLETHKSHLKEDNETLESKLAKMSERLYDYKKEIQQLVDSKADLEELADLKVQLRLKEKENLNQKRNRLDLAERCTALSEDNSVLQRRIERLVEKYRQLQGSLGQTNAGSTRVLTNIQNKVDYYKMKNTKAHYQVQDLKFINNFMKMSIQATNTHIQKDIKKLQDVGVYPDYELICKKKPTLKVILKFVLAAVRIKRKTEYSSVRNQKIELLEMKVMD